MNYSLQSDYCELAHPDVFRALSAAGSTQFEGYGLDEYSGRAAELIRAYAASPECDVHFVSGGTQANLLVISSALRPHEAVIAAQSGHIFVHETGAIEATGHKICTAFAADGKISAAGIEAIISEHCDEHMVMPRLVYISQSAETGLVYTKADLSELSNACRRHGLYLYIDGARLGAALSSSACDATCADIADVADAFYIGGTKNGAMFGEAIVIVNDALKADFRYLAKQRGAMLSKGAAIGIQFEALFTGGLYDTLAAHANAMAAKLADCIAKAGYEFLYPVQTNMIFPVLPAAVAAKLHERFDFYDWAITGDMITARLVTSWATRECAADEFADMLKV